MNFSIILNPKINILIIDDEEFNLIALKKILLKICANTEVFPYLNGLDALVDITKIFVENKKVLNCINQKRIDLIITDLNMPFINGYDFAK